MAQVNFEELEEVQKNELEALKAIFMDDYQEVINKSAWKVKKKKQEK
jgi:translation initiation factor 2-alpha kinase 4